MQKTDRRGFTLVELLVTISIIAVLTSVAIIGMGDTKKVSRDNERIAEIAQIQLTLELFYNACKRYPNATGGIININASTGCPSGVDLTDFMGNALPKDPQNNDYGYSTASSDSEYTIGIMLETEHAALGDPVEVDTGSAGAINCASTKGYCMSS